MGMPALIFRLWFGTHRLEAMKRKILAFVGIRQIRAMLLSKFEGLTLARPKTWLLVRTLGARRR